MSYAYRRLSAEDAAGVSACARAIYGDVYPQAEVYSPEKVWERNVSGAWISMVAISDGGVVGHMAIEPTHLGRVAEMGIALVLPDHRGHHVLEGLRDALVEEGTRRGLAGMFVEIELDNLASQGLANRSPTKPCGLTLSLWPGFGDTAGRRLSFIRYFRQLERPAELRTAVPERHRAIIDNIYAQFNIKVVSAQRVAASDGAAVVMEPHPELGSIFLTADGIGPTTTDDITREHAAFRADARLESAFLELPLGAVDVCEHAERLGFFFSGVSPHGARGGDALRLQCLKRDVAIPELSHPTARAIAAHIAAVRRTELRG